MPSYSKHDIILVRYPFSDLSSSKVRPAVLINAPHPSQDILITPLTSKMGSLLEGEFMLSEWSVRIPLLAQQRYRRVLGHGCAVCCVST
jgi:mRNA interferase MazF